MSILKKWAGLVYSVDLGNRKLSSQYVVQTDDIRSIVAAFQQAETASATAGSIESQRTQTADGSFAQSAPTLLQDSSKSVPPAPKKENTAAFWLDKGLLYATYGNDGTGG